MPCPAGAHGSARGERPRTAPLATFLVRRRDFPMSNPSWRALLRRWSLSLTGRPRRCKPVRPPCRRPRLERLEDRVVPTVTVNSHYDGMDIAGTSGAVPPDTCGAAGPSSYVETVNQDITI